MSRAWMPIYWGDYFRDTRDLTTVQHGAYLLLIGHYWQHEKLPTDEQQLAAIAGLSLNKWRKVCGPIAAKFQEGWRHKRIEDELATADRKYLQRAMAGRNGGFQSGRSRAIKRGLAQKDEEAKPKRTLPPCFDPAEAKTKPPETNHQVSIITSDPELSRSATEQAEPFKRTCDGRRPDQATRADLDAIAERRRSERDAAEANRKASGLSS